MRNWRLLSLFVLTPLAYAAEGMWTLDNPPIAQMQKELGSAPDQSWFDHAMHGSARIAGGCSASFVSKSGLVLTNHHCVAECVEQLSTAQKDFLKDGFLANSRAEEHICPAMEVNRLEKISDVTAEVKAATKGLEGSEFKKAQNAVKAKLSSACVGDEGKKVRCDVVDLYHGGQYKLYRYHRFQDVRLVFAPEQAAAFFGGDPDNFNFPRYDLDMSLVRVYENGEPAKVAEYFPFNPAGPSAGESVFVTGHPGSTQRELTMAQLAMLRDTQLPDRLLRLAEYRGVLTEFRTKGVEEARIANAELFYVENSYKVLRGQLEALLEPHLFEKKAEDEAALQHFVASHSAFAKSTQDAWKTIEAADVTARTLYQPMAQIENGRAFQSDYYNFAKTIVRGAVERSKPNAERLPEFNDSVLPQVEANLFSPAPIYPEFEKLKLTFGLSKMRERLGADNTIVHQILGNESPEQMATRLIDGTKLADQAERKRLWEGGLTAVQASSDPFIKLALAVDPMARELRKRYEREVESPVQKQSELIAQARFAKNGTNVYPDATFTLRFSYGKVEGWNEAGQMVAPFTRIGGAFDRATGADPFALPQSWLNAKDKLDLGKPFDLASTNDIIGGNSGSPMLDKNGQLVGLIFDGNIHSLGGAFGYNGAQNRAIAVDSAAILEALDKIYNAKFLADELRGQ
jgi:hypothetical protein